MERIIHNLYSSPNIVFEEQVAYSRELRNSYTILVRKQGKKDIIWETWIYSADKISFKKLKTIVYLYLKCFLRKKIPHL
jgi:hypothetical protein